MHRWPHEDPEECGCAPVDVKPYPFGDSYRPIRVCLVRHVAAFCATVVFILILFVGEPYWTGRSSDAGCSHSSPPLMFVVAAAGYPEFTDSDLA